MTHAIEKVIADAMTSTILYGVGVVTFSYDCGQLSAKCVPREEFAALGEHLKWLDQNAIPLKDRK